MAKTTTKGNLVCAIIFVLLIESALCTDMRDNGFEDESVINDTPSLNRLLHDALVERTQEQMQFLRRRLQEELETTDGDVSASQRTKQEVKRGHQDGIVSLLILSRELAEVQRERDISNMRRKMEQNGRKK